MDKEPIITFISDTLLASKLTISRSKLETIAEYFEPKTFAKNELFVIEGKVNTHNFYLMKGFMRAYTHNLDGEEVTTDFFSKNRPVFEASSLLTKTKSMENIQAITECEGFLLSFENINMLFHSVPEYREYARGMLVKEFAAYKKRTLSLINQTAEERYADLIQNNKEIFIYSQLKYIASYLGVTDSSLSRIRKEFSKKTSL